MVNRSLYPAWRWACVAFVSIGGAGGCADDRPLPSPPEYVHCVSYNIYFGSGSATISAVQQTNLSRFVTSATAGRCGIKPDPTRIERVFVVGRADKPGSDVANELLALHRAQNVARLLIESGVSREYICVQSRGSKSPMVQTEAAEPQNRSVEIFRDGMKNSQEPCPAGSVPPAAG